jgi:heme exporter protein D
MVDMLLGMILGMTASPLLMKLIRSLQQRRKVDRLLKEAADLQRQYNNNQDLIENNRTQ